MSRPDPELPVVLLLIIGLIAVAAVAWELHETLECERKGGVALRGALNPVVCARAR